MADTISVSEESAEGFAADIGGAASYFSLTPYCPRMLKVQSVQTEKGKWHITRHRKQRSYLAVVWIRKQKIFRD